MHFVLLGPQALIHDTGERTTIGGARLRVLLATLLLRANQPVSTDALAEAVWDGAPPAGAATTLRGHVLRLRRALGPDAGARVEVCDPGYLIRLAGSELDVSDFQELCRGTGAAIRDHAWADASATATGALTRWQGTPLIDVPCQALRDAWIPRLEQARVQALEWRFEADLRLGRRDQLVPELRTLVAEHPLRERFHAQLMLALAGSGRQAEALTAYQDARRVLIDELGIEPGPELRELHERVLTGDAGPLDPPRPSSGSARARTAVIPRQLPAAAGHFVGREAELKTLDQLLSPRDDTAGAVVISAIGGAAGIGKTALAIRWAHQAAPRFPDGQLYINLCGFDPSRPPMAPADALRRLLDGLGVPPASVPADPHDQAALYRSHLADRRMLILLDNARDAEQVRPLLPGSPGSLLLVTSRDQLGGLIALDGAVPLTLDLLTEPEARDLLIRRLGAERVLSDERAAAELITLCARLPLALSIAAARAALRPRRPLSELVDELRDTRRRLDTLTLGDPAADLRAVYSWSYRTLTPQAARLFRLLGLHAGPDIGTDAAAALAALDTDAIRHALDELTRAHLLTEHAPGRFGFHDLLRAYATGLAHTQDNDTERTRASRRVCDFYLHTTHAADRLINHHRPLVELDPPTDGARPHPLPDIRTATTWLDTEHPNLLAAQHTAAAHAWHTKVWQFAWTLTTYYRSQGRLHDQLALWQSAVDSVAHLPDPITSTLVHRYAGRAHTDLGHQQEAAEHLHRALALAEQHRDPVQLVHTHFALMRFWQQRGDDRQALRHATSALAPSRALELPVWEADALNTLGWCTARVGDYDTARTHCQAALDLNRRHNATGGEGSTLDSLGYIEHHSGRHREAVDYYRQALAIRRGLGNIFGATDTLDSLGHPHAALGRHEQARTVWRQALDLYRRQGRTEDAGRVQHQLDALDG